jgi:chemotaxis protein MotB
MGDAGSQGQPIIIRRKKVVAHGHHGGSWKVAFADFVTAMMAFFLLMWLLAQTSPEERTAIQGYFKDPRGSIAGQGGGLDAPGVGQVGPGGANTGAIMLDNPLTQAGHEEAEPALDRATDEQLRAEQAEREKQSLDELQKALEEELGKEDSAFIKLRDQIIIDQTALGLRIQLVDKENRPMFDSGESRLQEYAREVLIALAPRLRAVSNKLSVNGHTDAVAYRHGSDYSNWELSADRANSARRALVDGGYPEDKVLTVQGMGASVPRLTDKPEAPSNRRIVILVLKKDVEDALKGTTLVSRTDVEFLQQTVPEPATPPAAGPTTP